MGRRLLGRGGARSRRRAPRHERQHRGIHAWAAAEAKESPGRPAKIVAAFGKVSNQLVGNVDFDDGLLGARPELLHGLPGLVAELAVGLALEAVEPPQLNLRLPDLLARTGPRGSYQLRQPAARRAQPQSQPIRPARHSQASPTSPS